MNTKPTRFFLLTAAALLMAAAGIGVFYGSRAEQGGPGAAKEETLYTCGMHPQVIEHKPGLCPICGMKLTPIRKLSASAAAGPGERKIKYYKSTMMPGEVSPTPKKD